ncbi:DWD (DDB1-binding WD40 protein) hypersensitive to ABA 2 [Actinidia rufa]|uniref:DWD (DDB1-binding WD40 protein) hypersensitive to ABA 2 n=1 Tax=Actinidia rufa TaxID=165716 RepID=A0A7J0DM85_9ERIC|nr:DWD (DDB1-binding WD40 protein) hypersensitive to ABA 2 [Actinidia rufa]
MHLIRLSSGGIELVCEGLFSHPNEIWDLSSCSFDQRIFSFLLRWNVWDVVHIKKLSKSSDSCRCSNFGSSSAREARLSVGSKCAYGRQINQKLL